MPTSPFFNHYYASNEQNLIQDMVDESIYIQGLEIAYIPRSQDNIDFLYNEDPASYFTTFSRIEAYPIFVDGFDGGELMSMFGNEFQKSGTFVVSRRRFGQTFPEFVRPREGDLIFMPITNAILEIKYVDLESPFFEKGKQYVYEIKTEAFQFSYEEIETGDVNLDDILSNMNVPNQDTETEEYGDNDDLDTGTSGDIEFDPSNPFSVR